MTAQDIVSWLEQHVAPTAHLCLDTRQLRAGDVFFACPGLASDGRLYIQQAADAGASALVLHASEDVNVLADTAIPVLHVQDLPQKLGLTAHIWYGEPSAAMSVVALTGTNGKTSCVQWLAAALNAEGVPCGTVGTLGVGLPDGTNLGGILTTPDVLTMHRSLAAIRQAGAAVVALEASSIGLVQGRLDNVHIEIAGFTNLTHDHLDYHLTFSEYKRAKFTLFDRPELRKAVINADDPAGAELISAMPASTLVDYSMDSSSNAKLRAHDIQTGAYGMVFNLATRSGTVQILTRMVGEHNIANLLLVAGVLQELGWGLGKTARALAALRPVEGRLQIVESIISAGGTAGEPFVVVDYAHTPDALERALRALRAAATARGGKLVCVFGCGGGRDSSKRPIMGRIAAQEADKVILTTDNPRMEDPQAIINEIRAGISFSPTVEPNRAHAILSAVWTASPADVVLLAGKGHETYQECMGERNPFDDREWARLALSSRGGFDISTDTRSLRSGQLFLALKGEAFDGHGYLATAMEAGACAAIVEQRDDSVSLPQFELGDTRSALINISTTWRRLFTMPVIAVAGSNGKTTTKEMVASILRQGLGEAASLATQGNLNNDIGVPLTVLRMNRQHLAAVLELGMNHPGEIAVLAQIAQPTVALVNNAQREHQEFMHTVEAVARENGAVLESLPPDGTAVFPGDDIYTGLWTELAGERKIVRFGFDSTSEVYADQIHAAATHTVCQLHTPVGSAQLHLTVPGVHNLRNALAAAACAVSAGLPLDSVIAGLQTFSPVSGRMQLRGMLHGCQLIDDTYNANPDSVRAAIDVLAGMAGKKVLVLGDMAEVGADTDAMHAEVGAYAQEQGIDVLLTFGPASIHAAKAFGPEAGSFESIESLTSHLAQQIPAHILVKGSRSTRMERVVRALEEQLINKEEGARHAT